MLRRAITIEEKILNMLTNIDMKLARILHNDLISILDFMKASREEDKRERKAWEDRLSLHKEDMEKWAKNNVENFVTGLKSGLREGGVTDIADEVRRKKKEEDVWRN